MSQSNELREKIMYAPVLISNDDYYIGQTIHDDKEIALGNKPHDQGKNLKYNSHGYKEVKVFIKEQE